MRLDQPGVRFRNRTRKVRNGLHARTNSLLPTPVREHILDKTRSPSSNMLYWQLFVQIRNGIEDG